MKKIILILAFYSFANLYAQNDTVHKSFERLFITPEINYNLPGIGIRLNLGYNISRHFSVILSSGYLKNYKDSYSGIQQFMWDGYAKDYIETIYSSAEQTHQFIPFDLSIRYNFDVLGVHPYVLYQAGWNYLFNEGAYNVTLVTKYRNSSRIIETKTGIAADINNYSKTNWSFGTGLGTGVLIPLNGLLKIDISCSYIRLNNGLEILSLGAGLNFVIK